MAKQDNFTDDILKDYLSPETSEMAPEGFTSKVMSAITVEPIPASINQKIHKRNAIPVVSAVIFTFFVIAAFLMGGNTEQTSIPLVNFVKSLRIEVPVVDLSFLRGFEMPQWMVYLSISLLLLTIFDRALFTIFKKER